MNENNLDYEIVEDYLGETIFLRVDGYYFCEFQKQMLWSLGDIDHLKRQMNDIAAPKLYQMATDLLKSFGVKRSTGVFDVGDMTDEIKSELEKRFKDFLEDLSN